MTLSAELTITTKKKCQSGRKCVFDLTEKWASVEKDYVEHNFESGYSYNILQTDKKLLSYPLITRGTVNGNIKTLQMENNNKTITWIHEEEKKEKPGFFRELWRKAV